MPATSMVQPVTPSVTTKTHREVAPLDNGDRLCAGEFLRRYEAMPEVKKAELIQGIVFMASPVRVSHHGEPDGLIQTWLGTYSSFVEDVRHVTNTTVKLDPDNIPQPDALLFRVGGTAAVDEQDYLSGPPELVVEIAASSVSRDAGMKRDSYRRAGVREYLLWRIDDAAIDWWYLDEQEGDWCPIEPTAEAGHLESREFPGLVLNVEAALRLDSKGVLETLRVALEG